MESDVVGTWGTARRGINQARRLRKYMPRGPYSPVEREALAALVDVERAAGRLLRPEP